MPFVTIKPAPERVIRDHKDDYKLIPIEGKEVELDRVWKKRIADGDAEIVPEAPANVVASFVVPASVEISTVDAKKKEAK